MPDYKKLTKKNKRLPQVKRPAKSLFNKGLFLLLLLALLASGLYFGIGYFLLHCSDFEISQVSIVDTQGKPLENYQSIFHLDGSYNLFDFDMAKARGDILARHPELADVSLRKQFPDKLLIIIRAREPLAIIASLANTPLVDAEGFILPYNASARELPKIIGIRPGQIGLFAKSHSLRLKKALDLLKELKKAKVYPKYKLSRIDVKEYSNVVFHLEDNIEVKMGAADFARKATLLSRILAELKTTNTIPKYIDMRFGNPAVKP